MSPSSAYVRRRLPDIKDTRYTNSCSIGVTINRDVVLTVVSLDNLVKGASGQAVQNMNLMSGSPKRKPSAFRMFP
ncbi:MAG: hypothetical protein R3B51_12685 [Thermodesulfobacteriota bacterium]